MGFLRWSITAACVVGVPLTASAQVLPDTTTPVVDRVDSHWLASGFVGSSFAEDAESAGVDFGGTVGYLWRGVLGGEFQANWSPDFNLEPGRSALLLGEDPLISSYMGNAVAAIPLGDQGRFSPYISGGLGVLTLRSETLDAFEDEDISPNDSRAAGNIGFGVLAFGENVGFRGDVRYFNGFEYDTDDPVENPAEAIGEQILSELNFWRANAGLAFRW